MRLRLIQIRPRHRRNWREKLALTREPFEVLRSDADDRVRLPVNRQRFSYDAGIRVEPALPQRVAEDQLLWRAGVCVDRTVEIATHDRLDTQCAKVCCADAFCPQPLDIARCQYDRGCCEARRFGERLL